MLMDAFRYECDVLEYLPMGVMIVAPDLKIVFWNNILEQWTKLPKKKMLNSNLIEQYPHLDNPIFLQRLMMIFAGGPPVILSSQLHKYIIPCRFKEEQNRIQHTTIRGIKVPDKEEFFALFVIEDVTDLSNMLAEQNDRNKDMNLFLDVLTHDLNNYFLSSLGYLEITIIELQKEDDFLEFARAGIQLASELVTNVSVMMKTRISRSYKLYAVNLLDVLLNCEKTVCEMFPSKKIEMKKLNVNMDIYIMADSLFQQFILNLLTNAVKSDFSESVIVEIKYKRINDQKCQLIISDHGKGIKPEERAGIFNRYTQFRKSGVGSGLGLFIIKTLVERYKGKIWIESRDERDYTKGTRFITELQIANQ